MTFTRSMGRDSVSATGRRIIGLVCRYTRRRRAILLLAAALAAPSMASAQAPASDQVLDGWENTRWGMSRAEVSRLVPAARDWKGSHFRGPKGRSRLWFGVADHRIGDCRFRLEFGFALGRLRRTTLEAGHDGPGAATCLAALRGDLSARYGAPHGVTERPDGTYRTEEWLVGKTRIWLGFIRMSQESPLMGAVEYTERDSDVLAPAIPLAEADVANLVGIWKGRWYAPNGATGPFELTITRADPKRLTGQGKWLDTPLGTISLDISAKANESRFEFDRRPEDSFHVWIFDDSGIPGLQAKYSTLKDEIVQVGTIVVKKSAGAP